LFHGTDAPRGNRPVVEKAAEVIRQPAGGRVAVGRLGGGRLVNDRDQILGDSPVEGFQAWQFGAGDPADQLGLVVFGEGRSQDEQLVERQTERIHVAADVGPALEALRGHVAEGADEVAGMREVLLPGGLG
jgi:hypothetical protein